MQIKGSPLILHIETATDICSVAISEGNEVLALRESKDLREHARLMTVFIDDVLKQSGKQLTDLHAVSLSEGPGSYTSLRVGMSAAKALCFGADIPLIVVNTLYALALAAKDEHPEMSYYCPMIDARRMEVYLTFFSSNMEILTKDQAVILESDLFDTYLANGSKIVICGNGSDKAEELYSGRKVTRSHILCSAKHLVKPALESFLQRKFEDIAYFSPNYIKSPNITQAKNKLM